MKKWICFLIACALLLPLVQICCAQGTDQTKVEDEIVILLDKSGSMAEGYLPNSSVPCADQAVSWAQALCLDLAQVPVRLRMMAFNGNCEPVIGHGDMSCVDLKTLEEEIGAIAGIQFQGSTNQLKALKEASKDGLAGCSYVIISDGMLKLGGEEKDDDAAAECFQELCKELGRSGNHIYLLGLGTQLEMFDRLAGEEGITVLQNQDADLDKLADELLALMGRTVDNPEDGQSVSGQIPVTVDRIYEKVILSISSAGTEKPVGPARDQVELWDSENQVEEVNIVSSESTTFVYLQSPITGKYIVKVPDGDWNYRIRRIKKSWVAGIELTLLIGDEKAEHKDGVYKVVGENYNLALSIKAIPEDEGNVVGVRRFEYQLAKKEEDSGWTDISRIIAEQSGREWQQPIMELETDAEYTCTVKLELKDQPTMCSKIEISTVSPDAFSLEGTVGETISGSSSPELKSALPVGAEDIYYIWNGTEYHSGDQCGEFSVGEDGAITFQESETYQVELAADGVKVVEITFQITDPAPSGKSWLESFLEMIFSIPEKVRDFFSGIFSLLTG